MTEIGTRVTALRNVEDGKAYTFGDGTYVGDRVPNMEPLRSMKIENPCIELDDGGIVWGFECWWGPVESVAAKLGPVEFIKVEPLGTAVYEPSEAEQIAASLDREDKFFRANPRIEATE